MKKTVCDFCGKEVSIHDHPAIRGWFELYQQWDKTAQLNWLRLGREGRERTAECEGAWCDFTCLAKYIAKRLNREFSGLYPKTA